MYKPSSKPTEVDDGNVEVLRVEMEEGNGNSEGCLKDKSWKRLCFLYLVLRMKHDMLFRIC